jgi:predicted transcriptional regulator
MSGQLARTTDKTRLAVVLSAFLLVSSGFVPAISTTNQSNSMAVRPGSFFLILFALLDPFSSFSSTVPAHAPGVGLVQEEPTSTEVQTASPVGLAASYSSPSSTQVSTVAMVGIWADHSRKRSRFQIYVEILELLKSGPLTPFETAFYARLNHKRAKEYINLLERNGYLELVDEDGRTICVLSASGGSLVEKARAVYGLFESNLTTRKAFT